MPTNKEDKKLQNKLIENVAKEIELSRSYLLLLVFSVIIATLGLLVDSAAVVIGAMLIAPLFWPLTGLTVGIFTTRRRLAARSLFNIAVSIVLSLAIAAVIGWLTPIGHVTAEMQARLEPTIIDLFIALASAVIGIAAIYYPRISQTATGVAMSIALLPPLSVAGLGIAKGSWDMFWRAGLLFGTNVVAIIFAGLVTLYVLRFRPSRKSETGRFRIGLAASFIALVVLSIPLSVYLRDSLEQQRIQREVRAALEAQVVLAHDEATIDDVEVSYVPSVDSEVMIRATVYLPEGEFFTISEQNTIVESIATEVGATVNMQLHVVNTLQLRKEDDEQLRARRAAAIIEVEEQVLATNPSAVIASVDIVFADEVDDQESTVIEMLLHQQADSSFTFDQKEAVQTAVEEILQEEIELEVEFIQVQQITQPSEQKKLESKIEKVIEQDIADLYDAVDLYALTVDSTDKAIAVTAIVRAPVNAEVSVEQQEFIRTHIAQEIDAVTTLELQIQRYEAPFESVVEESQE